MIRIATALRKDATRKIVIQEIKDKQNGLHTIVCCVCGDIFKSDRNNAKYCTLSCKRKNNGKGRLRKYFELKCERCGKTFETRSDTKAKFCSQSCGTLQDLKNRPRKRGACGKFMAPV